MCSFAPCFLYGCIFTSSPAESTRQHGELFIVIVRVLVAMVKQLCEIVEVVSDGPEESVTKSFKSQFLKLLFVHSVVLAFYAACYVF